MATPQSDIWLAVLANGAPLLGFALWLTPFSFSGGGGWDFVKLFSLGIYMAAAGLVIPLAIWVFAGPGVAKTESLATLKFHAIIAVIAAVVGVLVLIASAFDPPNPTMSNPPTHFMAVVQVFFILAGFVLPFVELWRVVRDIYRVLG